jgi:sucrose-phosphate synthase
LDEKLRLSSRVFAERISINHSSRIITLNRRQRFEEYNHRIYRGSIDINDDFRFTVIPSGVNISTFRPDVTLPSDVDVIEFINTMFERDLTEERKHKRAILCVSPIDRVKNVIGLVEAYADNELLQELANLVIVLPGIEDPLIDLSDATEKEKHILSEIISMVETNDLWGKVSAFSMDNEAEFSCLYRYLATHNSVFVVPSFFEESGQFMLEAMSSGLPVVATNNGGTMEILSDTITGDSHGILVNPEDSREIGVGISELLSERKKLEYFRKAGMQLVMEKYSRKKIAEMYESVLDEIIKNKGKEPEPTEKICGYFVNTTKQRDISTDNLKDLYLEKAGTVNSRGPDLSW